MDILWIVDAQKDFIDPDGKLTVNAPMSVRLTMQKVITWAKKNSITIGYSQDWHEKSDEEISDDPDFNETYPEHCMANTPGAELIPEISTLAILNEWFNIKKTVFDVWNEKYGGGKQLTDFVERNNPDNIYVMGVATDVCVRFAVLGFLEKFKNRTVYVINDAIWGISRENEQKAINEMKQNGAKFISSDDLK